MPEVRPPNTFEFAAKFFEIADDNGELSKRPIGSRVPKRNPIYEAIDYAIRRDLDGPETKRRVRRHILSLRLPADVDLSRFESLDELIRWRNEP